MIPLDKNHDMELIKKAKKVCDSCLTKEQRIVAKKYMDLLARILHRKNSMYFNIFEEVFVKFYFNRTWSNKEKNRISKL
jgi:hypothetical protein